MHCHECLLVVHLFVTCYVALQQPNNVNSLCCLQTFKVPIETKIAVCQTPGYRFVIYLFILYKNRTQSTHLKST